MAEAPTDGSIRRVRFTDVDLVVVERVPRPVAGPGEVVVRVTSCGLCGSDASMLTGKHPVIRPPLVPGHELVGVVARTGDGVAAPVGERVAVLPMVGCDSCVQCRRGEPRLCDRMRLIGGQVDGGAADEVLLPASALVPIPDVPEAIAPIIEPLAVATHAVARVPSLAGTEVLVVGGGPIGLLTALAASAVGGVVTLVEPVEARQHVVAHFGVSVLGAVPEHAYDVVFDCVGGKLPETLLGSVLAGGTLVLVGVSAPELAFGGIPLQRQERSVLGSHMYTRSDVERAAALLADGLLPTDEVSLGLLFDRRRLDDAPAAFADLVQRRSTSLKILLQP